jgi:hypothetical protein
MCAFEEEINFLLNKKNHVIKVLLGVASENSWYLGDNKSAIILIPSQ